MKIGIDLRVLARGTRTGVEQYLIGLMEALKGDEKNHYKFFYNAWSKANLEFPWLLGKKREIFNFAWPNKFLDLSIGCLKRPYLDQMVGSCDVYFVPHFLRTSVKKASLLTTFHDLSFEYFPEFFSWRKRFWHRQMAPQKIAQQADAIVAVSLSTKDDLVNLYGVSPSKIKVIYSGVENDFLSQKFSRQVKDLVTEKYRLPKKFLLYFGTIEPRKNLLGLIKAFEILKKKRNLSDLHLVLAGSFGWLYEDILKKARQSSCAKFIHFPGFIETKYKPLLYQLAEIFVYPSFFEGFGFPPLEAMAAGTPVVCSNKTSLPEVVGEAGLLIDPYLPGELAQAIVFLLEDQSFKEGLIEKGRERVKNFLWAKTGKNFLNVLKEL